ERSMQWAIIRRSIVSTFIPTPDRVALQLRLSAENNFLFDRLARSNPLAKSPKNYIIDGKFTQPVSKADLKQRMLDVRFPLNGRHSPRRRLRQLCARCGRQFLAQSAESCP